MPLFALPAMCRPAAMIARRAACAAVLLGGTATVAVARCPVPGDLEAQGIRIVYADDTSDVMRRDPDGTVIVDGFSGDVMDLRLTLRHGVFLERFVLIEGSDHVEDTGNAVRYDFPEGEGALPPPAPDSWWEGTVVLVRRGDTIPRFSGTSPAR